MVCRSMLEPLADSAVRAFRIMDALTDMMVVKLMLQMVSLLPVPSIPCSAQNQQFIPDFHPRPRLQIRYPCFLRRRGSIAIWL